MTTKRILFGMVSRGQKVLVFTPKGLMKHFSAGIPFKTIVSRTKSEGHSTKSARSSSRFMRANIHCGIGTFSPGHQRSHSRCQ